MDKFLKNCLILLLVDKKAGRISTSTAIKKITDIISSSCIYFLNFPKIF